jgi:hypothetical protein
MGKAGGGRGGREICPKCGAPISYIEKKVVNGHTYYYAVHEVWHQGKRSRRKCYLGAEQYTYAELFNYLGLSGAIDARRYIRYLLRLLNYITARVEALDPAERAELVRALKEALEALEQGLEQRDNP